MKPDPYYRYWKVQPVLTSKYQKQYLPSKTKTGLSYSQQWG